MKQLTLTTATGTVVYDLASLVPLPAIKAGCLTFVTRAGMEVSVPAGDVLEFVVGTAPKMTKADKMQAALRAADEHLAELAAEVHEAANASNSPNDAEFRGKLVVYTLAYVDLDLLSARTQRYLERRAETERKRAAGETKPRAKKSEPVAFVATMTTTPTPKARKAKK